jgi:hypothetical protein
MHIHTQQLRKNISAMEYNRTADGAKDSALAAARAQVVYAYMYGGWTLPVCISAGVRA